MALKKNPKPDNTKNCHLSHLAGSHWTSHSSWQKRNSVSILGNSLGVANNTGANNSHSGCLTWRNEVSVHIETHVWKFSSSLSNCPGLEVIQRSGRGWIITNLNASIQQMPFSSELNSCLTTRGLSKALCRVDGIGLKCYTILFHLYNNLEKAEL